MKKMLLSALLASVAIPAFAADMPLKAPLRPEAIIDDWSGIYAGVAAGYAWGREKLTNDISTFDTGANSSLFGTGAPRLFSSPVIIQPAFSMSDCLISNCNTSKMNGFMAGGFAGAQKQIGNWVIGIEGSWDWTGMKKSHSATETDVESITRFLPTTTFTIPPQTAPVTVTVGPQGAVLLSEVSGLAPNTTIPAGSTVRVSINQGGNLGQNQFTFTVSQATAVDANGVARFATALGGTLTAGGQTGTTFIGTLGTTATGTAAIPAQQITLGLPSATTVRAAVTRTADLETKIDQIADIRGKFGLTNVFFGPNVLLYATGGAAVGHFNKSLSISQTTTLCTTQVGACVLATGAGSSRTDTFSATSGDTRLGWVAGAGIDWKLGGFVLGVLYRHHEFPKGTVAFNEGTNSLGFGTSRATVDSVQGRLSWLFPIH